MARGDASAQPGQVAAGSPAYEYSWRSGASENDEFFFPQQGGDVVAPPRQTPRLSGSISAGGRRSGSAVVAPATPSQMLRLRQGEGFMSISRATEIAEKQKADSMKATQMMMETLTNLQNENKKYAAEAAMSKSDASGKEGKIRVLSEQLAAAMSQLSAQESTITAQQQQIQKLRTPSESHYPHLGSGTPPAFKDFPARQPGGDTSPLPPRPKGMNPTASFTPRKNQMPVVVPNSSDDVFKAYNFSPSPGQKYGAADFEQKSLGELLSACFNKVETAIRKVPIADVVPMDDSKPTHDQMQVIRLLQEHLGTKKLAYELFKDTEGRYWAMIAIISHTIVDYIFQDQIVGNNNSFGGQTYIKAFNEEQATAQYDHPRVGDIKHRHKLAEQRASSARALIRMQGFWKWIQSTTYSLTQRIVRDFAVCFPAKCHYALTQELHKAVNEAVRIGVRMRQDPVYHDFNFPPTGTPWNSVFHVHRNQELMGQILGDDKSPYCVRIAMMPLIKSKSFAPNQEETVKTTTIHKAEVIVGDRDVYLRQNRRQK